MVIVLVVWPDDFAVQAGEAGEAEAAALGSGEVVGDGDRAGGEQA
jgi:hypothetical protein